MHAQIYTCSCCILLQHPHKRKTQPVRYGLSSWAETDPALPWSTSTWLPSPASPSHAPCSSQRLLGSHAARTLPLSSPDPARRPPRGVISGAQVDEEVPGPLGELQQVLHAAQVHLQQAGTSPDGHHAPGRHADVGVVPGQLHCLAVEVVGALRGEQSSQSAGARTARDPPSSSCPCFAALSSI